VEKKDQKTQIINDKVIRERKAQQIDILRSIGYSEEKIKVITNLQPFKVQAILTYLDAYDNHEDLIKEKIWKNYVSTSLLWKNTDEPRKSEILDRIYKEIRRKILLGKAAYETEIPHTAASLPFAPRLEYQNVSNEDDDNIEVY